MSPKNAIGFGKEYDDGSLRALAAPIVEFSNNIATNAQLKKIREFCWSEDKMTDMWRRVGVSMLEAWSGNVTGERKMTTFVPLKPVTIKDKEYRGYTSPSMPMYTLVGRPLLASLEEGGSENILIATPKGVSVGSRNYELALHMKEHPHKGGTTVPARPVIFSNDQITEVIQDAIQREIERFIQ